MPPFEQFSSNVYTFICSNWRISKMWVAWKSHDFISSVAYVSKFPLEEASKLAQVGCFQTDNSMMEAKDSSQALDSKARGPQRRNTKKVGTESRGRPSSPEIRGKKASTGWKAERLLLSNSRQSRLWIEACATSLFKCMIFIGELTLTSLKVSWFESVSTSSPGICSMNIWPFQRVSSTNLKQKRDWFYHSWRFPFFPQPLDQHVTWVCLG